MAIPKLEHGAWKEGRSLEFHIRARRPQSAFQIKADEMAAPVPLLRTWAHEFEASEQSKDDLLDDTNARNNVRLFCGLFFLFLTHQRLNISKRPLPRCP